MSAPSLVGKLTVTVHRAIDLKDVQTIGKQDPYCVLQLGTEQFKTRVHNNGGKNPSWEQSFLFNLTGTEDAIHIKINDSETLLDRPIGRVDIGLLELVNKTKNGPHSFMVHDVNNFSINAGQLSISTSFSGTGLVESKVTPTTQQQQQQVPKPTNTVLINNDVVTNQRQDVSGLGLAPPGTFYPAQQYQQQQQQQQQPVYQQQPQPVYQQAPPSYGPPQGQQQPVYQQAPQYYQGQPQQQQLMYAQPQYQQPIYQQQPQQQPMYAQPQYQLQQPGVVYTQVQPPSTVVYTAPPAVGVVPPVQQVYVPPPVVIMPGHPQYVHPR